MDVEGEAVGTGQLGAEPLHLGRAQAEACISALHSIPDPVPRFSSGLVIHLTEQAACWFDFMQLKSFGCS